MSEPDPALNPEYSFIELGLKDKNEEQLFTSILEAGTDWTPEERNMVITAYELVRQLHQDDPYHRDKPYIYHLLRNTARLTGYLHITDPEIVIAELLHDSVEDHPEDLANMYLVLNNQPDTRTALSNDPYDLQALALRFISENFSQRSGLIVAGLTNPPKNKAQEMPYDEWLEAYVEKIRQNVVMWEVWACKIVDWADNGVGIIHSGDSTDSLKLQHFSRKYSKVQPVLEDRYRQPDIQALLDDEARAYCDELFRLGRERLGVG